MKALIRSFAPLNLYSTHLPSSPHLPLPRCSPPLSAKCIDVPLTKKRFVLPGCLEHTTFHRLRKEPDLHSGQLRNVQTTQGAQIASAGWPGYGAGSAWTEPSLERFCRQKGRSAAVGQGSLLQNHLAYLLPVKLERSLAATDSFLISA